MSIFKKKGVRADIAAAAAFSETFDRPVVIVLSIDSNNHTFHTTSFGTTKRLCKLAGNFAEQIADAVKKGDIFPPDEEPKKGGVPKNVSWTKEEVI